MKNRSYQILLFEDNTADVYLVRLALQEARVPFQLECVPMARKRCGASHGWKPEKQPAPMRCYWT